MIEGNKIIFGHGTILVSPLAITLKLLHIDPSAIIGEPITQEFEEGMSVISCVSFKNLYKLLNKLSQVSEIKPTFIHEGFIFDFSQFNVKSVHAVTKGAISVIGNNQIALAC
jgi:hypothetical protein